MPRINLIESQQTAHSLANRVTETASAVQIDSQQQDLAHRLQHLSEVSFATLSSLESSSLSSTTTPITNDTATFLRTWISLENRRRHHDLEVGNNTEIGTYFIAQQASNFYLAYGAPINIVSRTTEIPKKSPAFLMAIGHVPLTRLTENPTHAVRLTNQLITGSLVTGTQATLLEFYQFIEKHCSGLPRTFQTGTHLNILSGLVSAKSLHESLFQKTLTQTTAPLTTRVVTAQDVIHAHDFSLEQALIQAKIDAQTGSNGGLSTDVIVVRQDELAKTPYHFYPLSDRQLQPVRTAITEAHIPIQETAQLVGLTLSLTPNQAERLNTVFADAAAIPLLAAILEVTK